MYKRELSATHRAIAAELDILATARLDMTCSPTMFRLRLHLDVELIGLIPATSNL